VVQIRDDFPTIAPDDQSYQKMWKAVQERNRTVLEKDIFIPMFSLE
jgi:hypothetical protein